MNTGQVLPFLGGHTSGTSPMTSINLTRERFNILSVSRSALVLPHAISTASLA